jgi:biopolymer transport protein ExbD
MAVRQHRVSRRRRVGINMTPMIDVVFLLIVFFMLVSNFASAENVPMELPNPTKSEARQVKLRDRVIINCQLVETDLGPETSYRVGPNPPESLEQISARLAQAKQAAEERDRDMIVVIRADRRLPFSDVKRAMQIVSRNKIEQLRLVAHVGERR